MPKKQILEVYMILLDTQKSTDYVVPALALFPPNSSKINFILCWKNIPPYTQPMSVHVALVSKEVNDLSQASY